MKAACVLSLVLSFSTVSTMAAATAQAQDVLLEQSYALSQTLTGPERLFYLSELTRVRTQTMGSPKKVEDWCLKLFQVASAEKDSQMRIAGQKNALTQLSYFNPALALQLLSEVDVERPRPGEVLYEEAITLTYTLQCLRKRNVHFPLNMPQLGQADTPVDDAIAVRANRCQVSNLLGNRLVIRHVASGKFWGAASDAVDFTGPASLFVFCPASLKECGKVMAQNQHRALAIAGWKPSLDPCAHGIFVRAKQTGDFLDGVAAVDFDMAMVRVVFCHDGYAS